jgi:threonine dehydrogenase-like Zn-dependent dehydrogenase
MQVPFVHGPGDLRLGNVEPPHAGPRDVVIRVATAGICGSDLGYTAVGGLAGPTDQPMPLGHELSGTIVELGERVQGFASGDRVVLNPLFNEVLAMLASGDIDVEPMVSHRFKGADFMAAFAVASRPDAAAKVLVQYSE